MTVKHRWLLASGVILLAIAGTTAVINAISHRRSVQALEREIASIEALGIPLGDAVRSLGDTGYKTVALRLAKGLEKLQGTNANRAGPKQDAAYRVIRLAVSSAKKGDAEHLKVGAISWNPNALRSFEHDAYLQALTLCTTRALSVAETDAVEAMDCMTTAWQLAHLIPNVSPIKSEYFEFTQVEAIELVYSSFFRLRPAARKNRDLTPKVLAWIEQHPLEADQSQYNARSIARSMLTVEEVRSEVGGVMDRGVLNVPSQLRAIHEASAAQVNLRNAAMLQQARDLLSLSVAEAREEFERRRRYEVYDDPSLDFHALTNERHQVYVAFWLLRHHVESGKWPDALPAGPMFLDGYSGEPFLYSVKSGSYELRSVGADLWDDRLRDRAGKFMYLDDRVVTASSP